jgi:hypothetical protein
MNVHIHAEDLASTLIEVDAQPLTLRLPAGAALFALRGEVWLTQEGRRDDVILAAGTRFDVASRAPIVVSATRGDAQVYVAHPADARAGGDDVRAVLRASAARLRKDEIGGLAAAVAARIGALGARWLARLHAADAGRPAPRATS